MILVKISTGTAARQGLGVSMAISATPSAVEELSRLVMSRSEGVVDSGI